MIKSGRETDLTSDEEALFFWKAIQELYHTEKKCLNVRITALWNSVMIEPCVQNAVLHGHKHAGRKNLPSFQANKMAVKTTPIAYVSMYAKIPLTAKLFAIRPKFAAIKLKNSDIFQASNTEDEAVTEMAKVQARFSDLIF